MTTTDVCKRNSCWRVKADGSGAWYSPHCGFGISKCLGFSFMPPL